MTRTLKHRPGSGRLVGERLRRQTFTAVRRRGLSLLEVVLSMAIFSALAAVAWFALSVAVRVWGSAGGRDDASRTLARSWSLLRGDLLNARLAENSFAFSASPPSSLGRGRDGDAFCFLSPLDPNTEAMATRSDGTAFMLRNVIYYLSVPTEHQSLFGLQCTGGSDAAGYEVQCPHKVLLRRVLDHGSRSVSNDPASEETLNVSWESLLTRPAGLVSDTSALRVVATNLLSFRCRPEGKALRIELYATAIHEARRHLALGGVPLHQSPYTLRETSTVYPQN